MKTRSLAFALCVALASVAGSASAGVETDQFTMSLTVEAACAIDASGTSTNDTLSPMASGLATTTYLQVVCNDQLPYVLEIDNLAGGVFVLEDATSGLTVQGNMSQTPGGISVGSVANGDGWSRVGTGIWEVVPLAYSYDFAATPAVGVYTGLKTASVNF